MRIKDAINKYLFTAKDKDHVYLVIRDRIEGVKEIPFSQIERVDNNYVYLIDGETVIPIHRVLEIKSDKEVLWRR